MKIIYKIVFGLLMVICAYSAYRFVNGYMMTYTKILNLWRFETSATSNDGKAIGSVATTASLTTGKFGMGYENTATSYINRADRDDRSFTDGAGNDKPFSFAVRMNPQFGASSALPFCKRTITSSTTNPEWCFIVLANQHLRFTLYGSGNTAYYIQSETAIPLYSGNRYHVAGTYDGSETAVGIKLYINGLNQTSIRSTSASGYAGMLNGPGTLNLFRSNTVYLLGKFDELQLFNTVLSESNIRRIMVGLHPF